MTIMKRFIGFVKKEFYHIFRDKRSLFILFGMPIAQILLFGFAITNEINNVDIAILDQSNDIETQKIIYKIKASPYFNVENQIEKESDIESEFKKGKIKAVLIFEPNFSKNLETKKVAVVQAITDATEPNVANTIANYTSAIIQNYQSQKKQSNSNQVKVEVQSRMFYNPELKSVFNFVPGVMALVLLLICVLMTSVSIVREKENGTMELLLVAPFNPVIVILAKAVPYFMISLFNLIIILLLSVFVLDMKIMGSLTLLFAESTLLIVTALSLGLLIIS